MLFPMMRLNLLNILPSCDKARDWMTFSFLHFAPFRWKGVRRLGFLSMMLLSLSTPSPPLYASLFPSFLLNTVFCYLLDGITRFIMGCREMLLKMLVLIIQILTGKILPTRNLQRIQKERIHIGGMFLILFTFSF